MRGEKRGERKRVEKKGGETKGRGEKHRREKNGLYGESNPRCLQHDTSIAQGSNR